MTHQDQELNEKVEKLKRQVLYSHTKVLLKKLKETRIPIWYGEEEVDGLLEDPRIEYKSKKREILKKELATREHVLNKKESKAKRLLEIKSKNTRGRSDKNK